MAKRKQARRKGKAAATRDRRSERHIKVVDAAQVIAGIERWAQPPHPRADRATQHIALIAHYMLTEWRRSQVVLRADLDFVQALLDSDTDVELVPDWLDRLPFGSVACSLPEPVSVHDGSDLCHYAGFIATGIRNDAAQEGASTSLTRYGPFTDKPDGARFLWVYTADGDPTIRCQTVTVHLRGGFYGDRAQQTIAELITTQQELAAMQDQPWGEELPTLVPLSLQFLLYLAAPEPDLDWLPPQSVSRPQQLHKARIGNVGWRVGGALRTWRQESNAAVGDRRRPGPGGWRLPPHLRRAHWHRVRVATRDDTGAVVGDRSGVMGVDWHYELRWYPPAPVNVADDAEPPATVRDVDTDRP